MVDLSKTYEALLDGILSQPENAKLLDDRDRNRMTIIPANGKKFTIIEINNKEAADTSISVWEKRTLLQKELGREDLAEIFGTFWKQLEQWREYQALLFVAFQTENKWYEMLVDCAVRKVLAAYWADVTPLQK